jgi:hypothetical protein
MDVTVQGSAGGSVSRESTGEAASVGPAPDTMTDGAQAAEADSTSMAATAPVEVKAESSDSGGAGASGEAVVVAADTPIGLPYSSTRQPYGAVALSPNPFGGGGTRAAEVFKELDAKDHAMLERLKKQILALNKRITTDDRTDNKGSYKWNRRVKECVTPRDLSERLMEVEDGLHMGFIKKPLGKASRNASDDGTSTASAAFPTLT